ncbi:MAG TPA: glycosyltransferase [Acidimicrobiia bacterium]|nr:glycosyltransferase [Acidimicrobiia bacterium]
MKVQVVSPWYPDYASPYSGVFVQKQVEALRVAGHDVYVDVPQIFPAPPGPIPETVTSSMRALGSRSLNSLYNTVDSVTYVPTPVPTRSGHKGRAEAMALSVGMLSELSPRDADITHAHLGLPTAWAISAHIGDRPLVVTEHQSTLASVLDEPPAARAYEDVIRHSDAFICVSEHLRGQLASALGDWVEERVLIVPNIVDLAEIPFRSRPHPAFRSWIYVGGLVGHKGVQELVLAFTAYKKQYDQGATLTLVGEGQLRRWIEAFAVAKGISGSINLAGAVEHRELGRLFDDADVMVHLSPAETFGIAPLEAIGAGLPVVSIRNQGAFDTWGDFEARVGTLLDIGTDPSRVADAVARLRDTGGDLDPETARRLVEERYSPNVVAEQLTAIYERVRR